MVKRVARFGVPQKWQHAPAVVPILIGRWKLSSRFPGSFTVHWKPGTNYVSLAADVATTGWVALGWSPDGRMLDSDAVLFNTLPTAYPFASDVAARVVMLGNTSILPVADTDGYSFVIRNAKVLITGGRTLAE